MDVKYVCQRLKELCGGYRTALERGDEETAERLVRKIRSAVSQLSMDVKESHMDSAFFAGELADNAGERNVRYPHVEAFKKRRHERLYGKEKAIFEYGG